MGQIQLKIKMDFNLRLIEVQFKFQLSLTSTLGEKCKTSLQFLNVCKFTFKEVWGGAEFREIGL